MSASDSDSERPPRPLSPKLTKLPAVFPSTSSTTSKPINNIIQDSTLQKGTGTDTDTRPWASYLTIDLLLTGILKSFFHPFITALVPLCLRAQVTPYSHPSFIAACAWAAFVSFCWLLAKLNRRLAFGAVSDAPTDLEDEVIVVAGGGSLGGVGALVAEVYGMRGVRVAVLDVKDEEEEGNVGRVMAEKGVRYYRCDVGVREEVERAHREIEKDLGTPTTLVSAYALAPKGPLLSTSRPTIDAAIRSNLHGPYNLLTTFLPAMLNRNNCSDDSDSPDKQIKGGTLITLSSVLAHTHGAANLSLYAPAKALQSSLHHTITSELRALSSSSSTSVRAAAAAATRTLLLETGQIATPLFADVPTPSPFWAPVLDPVEVAREIVGFIDGPGRRSGEVRLPAYAGWVGGGCLGLLPASLRGWARAWAGVDRAVGACGVSEK